MSYSLLITVKITKKGLSNSSLAMSAFRQFAQYDFCKKNNHGYFCVWSNSFLPIHFIFHNFLNIPFILLVFPNRQKFINLTLFSSQNPLLLFLCVLKWFTNWFILLSFVYSSSIIIIIDCSVFLAQCCFTANLPTFILLPFFFFKTWILLTSFSSH